MILVSDVQVGLNHLKNSSISKDDVISKNEDLIVNFNLFEENKHLISNCDVEWSTIIWKLNYARRAKNMHPMQLF